MKKEFVVFISLLACFVLPAGNMSGKQTSRIVLKSPGNPAQVYELQERDNGILVASETLPVEIYRQEEEMDGMLKLTFTLRANETVYYNLENYLETSMKHDDCQFYMPGFWYRRNLRSPQEAPSFHTSDSWQVREDRLSVPLTGIYNEKNGDYYTVLRVDDFKDESLTTHPAGEVILTNKTSIGYTGFENKEGISTLVFGFPYHEAPKTYIRKLTLAPAVQAFEKMEKGEPRELVEQHKAQKANQ